MVPSRRNGPSFHDRRPDVAQHQVEQRLHAVIVGSVQARCHPALLGRTVEDREIELFVGGVERGEQVEDFVEDLCGPGIRAIDLVDDDDGFEAHLQRFGDNELGLRQRAFGGVDQHQRTVDHIQNPFDLAAEIGMAGGIHDIDARVLPHHRGRLGQDRDAAFALEIIGIHRALDHALVLAERARLLQQPIDQRRLAVVDMRDNGDVSKIHCEFQKSKARAPWGTRDSGVFAAQYSHARRGCNRYQRMVEICLYELISMGV